MSGFTHLHCHSEYSLLRCGCIGLGTVAWHKALVPAGESIVVFRDNGFADDLAKTNLTAILHQNGPTIVRSL